MRRRLALSWRLTLAYTVLLAALLIVLGAYLDYQLSRFAFSQMENRLLARVATFPRLPPRQLPEPFPLPLPAEGRPAIPPGFAVFGADSLASGLASTDSQGLTTTLLWSDGTVIVPTEPPTNWRPQDNLSTELLQGALDRPEPRGPQLVRAAAGRFLVVDEAINFPNEEPKRIVAQVSAPLSDVDDLLRSFRIALSLGIAAMIALALGVGQPLGRVALRPLGLLTQAISRISPSQLSEPIPVPDAKDEVRELALAFNTMLEEINVTVQADRRSQQELRRSQDQLRRFVGDASHELRSPLTSLTGYMDLLGRPLDVPQDRILEPMRREVDRMNHLVQDLLALTRLDATPSTPAEVTQFDLAEVVDDILAGIASMAKSRHVSLVSVGDGPFPMSGDQYGIERVIENLVRNAIQHTPDDGSIELRLARNSGWLALEVSDTGEGIGAEHLPHVFDRFYRADMARGRSQGNVGLGLAIVKAIVEQHGGTVNVRSRPGIGTTFTVNLPLSPFELD